MAKILVLVIICAVQLRVNYGQRVPCVTPDYKNGACTPWHLCTSFQNLIKNIGPVTADTKNYLKRFQCEISTDTSQVYVCCTQAKTDVVVPNDDKYTNEEYCGIQDDLFKVTGGTEAQLGQFPWLALLQYRSKGELKYKCGGTLINRRYVLTAAHCTDGYGGNLVNVVVGEHDVTSKQDCVQGQCSIAQIIPVEKTIQHPGWVNAASRFAHDLALVRLTKNAEYDVFVQPICLPPTDYSAKRNENFTVAGWGQTENSASSNVKRYAIILLQDRSSCMRTVPIRLGEGQICLGGGSADSCRGDSGGPLMKNKLEEGKEIWSIIGVVSFGYNKPCGTLGRPGIYTYVPEYVDWIKQNSKY